MEASWTALWTILGEARECKERKHFECITHVGYACTNWRRYHAAQRGAWAVMLFAKVSSAISSGSSVSRAATTRIIEALSIVVPGYQGEGWSRASLSLSLFPYLPGGADAWASAGRGRLPRLSRSRGLLFSYWNLKSQKTKHTPRRSRTTTRRDGCGGGGVSDEGKRRREEYERHRREEEREVIGGRETRRRERLRGSWDDVGRVQVWRLPKTIDAREVKEIFRGVGTVTEAVVHTQDGSPKARATVTFADSSQAERAVRKMHGKLIEGIGDTISPCNHMYSYTPPTHSITHSTEKDAPGATLRANSSTSPISGGERGENPPPGDPSSAARRRSRRSPVSSAVGPRPPSSRHTEVTSLSVIPHGTMSLNLLRSGSTLRATPWVATPPEILTPIAATFLSPIHTPVAPGTLPLALSPISATVSTTASSKVSTYFLGPNLMVLRLTIGYTTTCPGP